MKKENKFVEIIAFIGRLLMMLKMFLGFRKARKPEPAQSECNSTEEEAPAEE